MPTPPSAAPVRPMNLAFVYGGGRSSRLDLLAHGEAPDEFFFGLPHLHELGHEGSCFDQEPGRIRFDRFGERILFLRNRFLARHAIGYNRIFSLRRQVDEFQRFDWLVGVPDTIGLSLAWLRVNANLRPPICAILMGLAGKLDRARRNPLLYHWLLRHYRPLLSACKRVVCLGEAEAAFLREKFPSLASRVHLIPFGVDTEFWRPPPLERAISEPGEIVFVGNDRNRDFDALLKIAEALPDEPFRIVTTQLSNATLPANVTLVTGSLRTPSLTDAGLRELYWDARCVILPLRDTLQPSGQSVSLQAMACGTPVILTRIRGFWEPGRFESERDCLFMDTNDSAPWAAAIRRMTGEPDLRVRLSENGRARVLESYTSQQFAQRLERLLRDAD